MAKMKRPVKNAERKFDNNPFGQLKGFAVSEPQPEPEPEPELPPVEPVAEEEASFENEMDSLGVKPLDRGKEFDRTPQVSPARAVAPPEPETDEEIFLDALGELDVRFSDHYPEDPAPAQARRIKQLRQGKLTPEASLDLHGAQRHEVADKLRHFLQNALHNNWQTLLIVTGRGLHSEEGVPVLREEVERLLRDQGKGPIAEWGRAPRQYGGDGAVVVFLKKRPAEEC